MQITDSRDELARLLLERRARLISVDGAHGSGKSTLSRFLAGQLGADLVEIDQFLNLHQGAYLQHLDYEAIASRVVGCSPCILEGICLCQVVKTLGLRPDASIYVKRMARWGWADEDELVIAGPVDVHLGHLIQDASHFFEPGDRLNLGLWEEVIRYHAIWRPQQACDFVFLRKES